MVKKYTRKHQKITKKKRKWFVVSAPKEYFKGVELGELLALEGPKLVGRQITTNVSNVTNIRNPNISLTFRINEVKDEKASTELVGYEMSQAFVKRATRKKRSKVEYALNLKSKDGVDMVVKVFLITRSLVSSKIRTDLRNRLRGLLEENFKSIDSYKLFEKVLGKDLQSEIKNTLKHIYPLASSEVRVLKKKSI